MDTMAWIFASLVWLTFAGCALWVFRATPKRERAPIELEPWRNDLDLRLKALEREHDDLHAAYRRLRAVSAQEARRAPLQNASSGNGGDPEQPSEPKDELRRRAAALLRR